SDFFRSSLTSRFLKYTAKTVSGVEYNREKKEGQYETGRHPKMPAETDRYHPKKENATKIEDIREDTRETTVICVLMEGPAVSLKGSPTVSPMTAALWALLPLPPSSPDSTYFLELSQRPPALDINRARRSPLTMFPRRKPPIAWGPPMNPTTTVERMLISPAGISSFSAPVVAISIHLPYSALTPFFPSRRPGIVSNWRWISATILWAFLS